MSATAEAPEAMIAPVVRGYWRTVALRLGRDRLTTACLLVLVLILLSALLAPAIAPYDPYRANMVLRLKPLFSPGHLLGTDELGRDMLTRLIYGGRMSLLMGFAPVTLALLIGGGLGVTAGFIGGFVNSAIMRTMDVFYAFPSILLAVAISGALGAGMTNALLSLTVVFVPPITRMAESVTTGVRGLDYVEIARATGTGHLRRDTGACAAQRAGTGVRLCQQPGQRQHHPGVRAELPEVGRASTRCRVGADAQHIAPGIVDRPDTGGAAGRDDLRHLALLQHAE